jgi:tetratricopeptide (TPR) repeat protein
MNRLIIIFFCVSFSFSTRAQETNTFYELGKKYLTQSDFANAETNLIKALESDSNNIQIKKDLSLCLIYNKKYNKALSILFPLISNDSLMDEQCYQIAGNAYKGLKQLDLCDSLYLRALKKFPHDGAIHNEIGELLSMQNNTLCIDYWEKGIKVDPNYAPNYYHATKYYFQNKNIPWCLLYGEIFVNLDSYSLKTTEIKEILLKAQKSFFTNLTQEVSAKGFSAFEQKFVNCFYNQKIDSSLSINESTLTMLRTRFVLNWFNDEVFPAPFQLFNFHRQLLREGLFDGYNQWLFGATESLANFQRWTQLHDVEYNAFTKFQSRYIFKIPSGQYYH